MNRPAWQRFLVILAGPMVNWILAVVLLAGLFTVGHRVPTGEPVVEEVSGAPAAAAGLMPGDRVIAVNGRPVANWDELRAAVGARRGQPIELRVQRRGGELTLTARPGPDGRLGITAESRLERYRVAQAIPLAFETSGRILADTLVGLGQLFRGGGKVELLGPIGIVSETAEAASLGLTYLFGILVQISMVLALMNLLPLPALDGGRLAFICVAMIRRRPVSPKIEAVVHGVGLILLLGLLLFATYGDIGRQLTRSREPDAGVPAAQPMETP
jgi:regulator of sigma E protease